jgi:hypothetical protein
LLGTAATGAARAESQPPELAPAPRVKESPLVGSWGWVGDYGEGSAYGFNADATCWTTGRHAWGAWHQSGTYTYADGVLTMTWQVWSGYGMVSPYSTVRLDPPASERVRLKWIDEDRIQGPNGNNQFVAPTYVRKGRERSAKGP